MSEATTWVWRNRYAHLGVSEVGRQRQRGEENARQQSLVGRWRRETPVLESWFPLSATDTVRALNQAIAARGLPTSSTCRHGTKLTTESLEAWACALGLQLDVTRLSNR